MRFAFLGMGFLACTALGCGSDPEAGADGARGPAGVPGAPGVPGQPGTPGAPGSAGAPGKDGAQGPEGKPGGGGPVSGARLKVRYRLGEDGSKEPIAGAWWDSQLGVDCSFSRAADGAARCLPAGALISTGSTVYLDDACVTAAVEYLPPAAGCTLPFVDTYGYKDDAACAAGAHVYALGAVVDPSTIVYLKQGIDCKEFAPLGSSVVARAIGAEVDPTNFVGATSMHD